MRFLKGLLAALWLLFLLFLRGLAAFHNAGQPPFFCRAPKRPAARQRSSESSNLSPHSGQNLGGCSGSSGSHPHLSQR